MPPRRRIAEKPEDKKRTTSQGRHTRNSRQDKDFEEALLASEPVEGQEAQGKPIRQGRRTRNSQRDKDVDALLRSPTADEILARSPPPDALEKVSEADRRAGKKSAPLLSGGTQDEKDNHKRKLGLFPVVNPEPKMVIAGVPNAPQNLDPPGNGSPFDALKHPKKLIATLNRLATSYYGLPSGWDEKSMKKIPNKILTELTPVALAMFPASVRSNWTAQIRARLPSEPAAVTMLAGPAMPPLRGSYVSGGGVLSPTSIMAGTHGDGVVAQRSFAFPPRPRLSSLSDSSSDYGEDTHTGAPWEDEEDVSDTRNVSAGEGINKPQPSDQLKDTRTEALEEDEDSEETLQLKLAAIETKLKLKKLRKRKAESQPKHSEGALSQSLLNSAAPLSRPVGVDSRPPPDPISSQVQPVNHGTSPRAESQSRHSEEVLSQPPLASAAAVSGSISRDITPPGEPISPEPVNTRTSRRLAARKRLMEEREEGLTSPILPTPSKRRRVSSNTSKNDPPSSAGLSTGRSRRTRKPLPPAATDQPDTPKSSSRLGSGMKGGGSAKVRSAKVCNQCRAKRLKCDGVRPKCTPCENAGIVCSLGVDGEREGGEQPEADEEEEGQPDITGAPSDIGLQYDGTNDDLEDGPSADNSDPQDVRFDVDVEKLHRRPFVAQLEVTKELAGKFIGRSSTDHLTLQEDTNIPLELRPKPVSVDLPNFPKETRFREHRADRDVPPPQEENFMTRPSVRIVVPDHIKNLLVDDWENVTKSLLVVPLPSQAPVNFIIDSYFDEEKGKRRLGSAEADVLEEFVAGMKVYFEKAIGKTLLYKFERPQWAEIRQLWESGKYPEWNGKGPGDAYGAEHLCRMLVNMPEMIAQTNMDVQSVNRLREEISRLCTWLARNSGRFFCAKYEKPTAEYIEGAR